MYNFDLSIVIPVYLSKDVIRSTVEEIEETIKDWCDSYEIILVNDGSTDGSYDVIREMSEGLDHIKAYNLSRNFGQHNAIIAGLNFAEGRKIIIMDDDGQHDPKYIKEMVEQLQKGYDAVYIKYYEKIDPLYKNLGSRLNDMMAVKFLNKPKDFYLSSFKAITKELKDEIIKYHGPYPYIDGLIMTLTQHVTSIRAEHRLTTKGKTTYSLRKLISLWLNMLTNFSIIPLRAIFVCGVICGVLSISILCGFFVAKIINPEYAPRGWTTIFLLIILFGAIQFISLGLIGEYVGRILLLLNKRPQYFVKNEVRKKK